MESITLQLTGADRFAKEEDHLYRYLGMSVEKGHCFQEDPATAAVLYRAALKGGDTYAGYLLGTLYEEGLGVAQDWNTAKHLYYLAAQDHHPEAMLALGLLFEKLDQPETAYLWYRRSAAQGDQDAIFHCGLCLHRGHGTDRDYAAAFHHFKYLANNGHPEGAYYAGVYYQDGIFVPQDYGKAMKHYTIGTEADHAPSWNQVGVLYEKGLGVEPDAAKALECFCTAANLGSSTACTNAAWLYESGAAGEEPDLDKAVQFYRRAASAGEPNAIQQLDRLGIPWDAADEVPEETGKPILKVLK